MTAWMHVKVIRTFVEAVLRYGLPVDYTTVITRCVPTHQQLLFCRDRAEMAMARSKHRCRLSRSGPGQRSCLSF
jgi:hypothetical protein